MLLLSPLHTPQMLQNALAKLCKKQQRQQEPPCWKMQHVLKHQMLPGVGMRQWQQPQSLADCCAGIKKKSA